MSIRYVQVSEREQSAFVLHRRFIVDRGSDMMASDGQEGTSLDPITPSLWRLELRYCKIHAFCFTISLWVVSGCETRFDAEVLVQGSHETCSKLRAAIRVCLSRDAVESENVFVVQVSYTFG